MMDLDLDDPNLFEKLPRDQQEDFKRALSDGRLSNLIELWQPWWKQKQVLSLLTLMYTNTHTHII
jgi:uncharacterized protein YihD (DUF1040 family)